MSSPCCSHGLLLPYPVHKDFWRRRERSARQSVASMQAAIPGRPRRSSAAHPRIRGAPALPQPPEDCCSAPSGYIWAGQAELVKVTVSTLHPPDHAAVVGDTDAAAVGGVGGLPPVIEDTDHREA